MGQFDNHVVIITGSGRGIGAEAAKQFAAEGAKVVINDLNPEPAQEVANAIKTAGGEALVVAGDVTASDFPERILSQTIKAYGKLNILVNNAGFTWDGMVHKMTDDQWEAILSVHATTPFRMIRAATPYLRDTAKAELESRQVPENRCIINVSSTSGLHGNIGQANYAFAKMGVVGLTKTIAKEWGAFGVRCNAVAFGFIDTRLTQSKEAGEVIEVAGTTVALGIPQKLIDTRNERSIPLNRPGSPKEAAAGILLMASPMASYITGHTLEVTGGMGI